MVTKVWLSQIQRSLRDRGSSAGGQEAAGREMLQGCINHRGRGTPGQGSVERWPLGMAVSVLVPAHPVSGPFVGCLVTPTEAHSVY